MTVRLVDDRIDDGGDGLAGLMSVEVELGVGGHHHLGQRPQDRFPSPGFAATVLGSLLLSVAGRDDWAPDWLVWWGAVAAAAGAVTVVAIIAGGLSTYGQVIIPVGVGWTIATGMVLLRQTCTGAVTS